MNAYTLQDVVTRTTTKRGTIQKTKKINSIKSEKIELPQIRLIMIRQKGKIELIMISQKG